MYTGYLRVAIFLLNLFWTFAFMIDIRPLDTVLIKGDY